MAPDYVGAINSPDIYGPGCNFDSAAVKMDSGAHPTLGLPGYLASYFYTLFRYSDTCYGSATQFSIADNSHIDSIRWNFDDPASGRFNTSAKLSTSHIFSHLGTFKVSIATYIEGVRLDDTLDVAITKPEVNLGHDTSLCCICHDTIKLNAYCENCSYRWNDGSYEAFRVVTQPGDYWVTVRSGNCSASDTIHIANITRPLFSFRDTAVCDSFTIMAKYAGANNQYRWQDGTGGSRYTTYNSGRYYVTATNDCAEITDSVNITITNCDCYLYIPNSFTPDHNGLNETFKPRLCSADKYQMEIFNRWGEKLFETHDLSTGWNGTFNGKSVVEGAYIYRIRGYNHYTGFIDKKGVVFLLKPGG
jgi:gliding motility-associated-like protein